MQLSINRKSLFHRFVPILLCLANLQFLTLHAVGQDFPQWSETPPMGWNSWDAYGASVTETEVRANAKYMADRLVNFGWQYIVVDIRWHIQNEFDHAYNQDNPVFDYDANGRLLPSIKRFPSADGQAAGNLAGGNLGFKPLADYTHSLGLKFGIHIMRGMNQAVWKADLPIADSSFTTKDIQRNTWSSGSVDTGATWLHDSFGMKKNAAAQAYYDSLFKLYASWGVDYVKVDDLLRDFAHPEDSYYQGEIEMIRQAIDKAGRPMVLSLSPGAAPLSQAKHLRNNANMWRITDDLWDDWGSVRAMFKRAHDWTPYRGEGCWPDNDMLPLGRIGIRAHAGKDRMSRLTQAEQQTLMSLWSISRSPLMFGGDLPSNDAFTLSLLTNSEVLAVNQNSSKNRQISRFKGKVVWLADAPQGGKYLAVFNLKDAPQTVAVKLDKLGFKQAKVRDLWGGKELGTIQDSFQPKLGAHASGLYLLTSADAANSQSKAPSFPVDITIDASKSLGKLPPIWRFFGADEPNYATMKNGRKLLRDLGDLRPKQVFFRAHNLLTTGDGKAALKWGSTNVYQEDDQGNPIYDWTIVDGIFDAYIENDVRPYVQIGFMPKALSIKPEPYQHKWRPGLRYEEVFTGWSYPPKDYEKWGELVYQWVLHCIDRYGREEVATWYWQTWNESNAGYWRGSSQDYLKLHDYAIDAVRRALPTAKVGGADTAGAGGEFTHQFIDHCIHGTNYANGKQGTPIDFVSFHAKGSPKFVDGHVRMGIAQQLREVERGFRIVAAHPEVRDKPIVIGESDPEGCAACQGPQMAYRNGTMYSSYTAASFARKLDLARKYQVNFEGALTWAFEFENQPLFAGFRALSTGGINKPVLNVFRMFSKMSGNRVPAQSDHAVSLNDILRHGVRERPDVSALASRDGNRLCILSWHYHDDDLAGEDAAITLKLSGLPETSFRVTEYRVDREHSNAYETWLQMGSPAKPTAEQYVKLERSAKLAKHAKPMLREIPGGNAEIAYRLARQAVSLIVIEWDN